MEIYVYMYVYESQSAVDLTLWYKVEEYFNINYTKNFRNRGVVQKIKKKKIDDHWNILKGRNQHYKLIKS